MHPPRLAHCVWPLSPLLGATPAARQSRFCGVSGEDRINYVVEYLEIP
jgi:hypothetical protein